MGAGAQRLKVVLALFPWLPLLLGAEVLLGLPLSQIFKIYLNAGNKGMLVGTESGALFRS